jgi:hypothetical protein
LFAKTYGGFVMDTTTTEHVEAEMRPGDLLVGAEAIRAYLVHLGMPEDVDIYYLRRTRRWPIFNTGGKGGSLIASKFRLLRYADQITRGSAAA